MILLNKFKQDQHKIQMYVYGTEKECKIHTKK